MSDTLDRTIEQSGRIDAFVSGQIDAHMAYIAAERKVTELEREVARLRKERDWLWRECRDMAAHESYDDLLDQLDAMGVGE